jgi:hypothetical protein
LTNMRGKDYTCTCRMGRGSFGNCNIGDYVPQQRVIPAIPTTTTGRHIPYPSPTYPNYEVTCRDRYNPGRPRRNGESWIQWRGSEPWTCRCSVHRNTGHTRCRWGYNRNH